MVKRYLTYNVNDDPRLSTTNASHHSARIDPPAINIKQGTDLDSLVCAIMMQTKSVWYTVDGGEKIPLMTEVLEPVTEKKIAIKMGLSPGNHQIVVGADDYFRLSGEKAEQRTIAANALPVITITSPVNGQVYSQDVQLTYSITDTDFASAWYTINNGTKTTISQNGTIPLTLADGLYKIVIVATDQKPQTAKDSVNFEINRPPVITITAPIDGTVYDKDIQLIYSITDTDYESAWYSLDGGNTKINISQSGTIQLQLPNGLYALLLAATDKKSQTTSKSITFEMKKSTGIENTELTEGIEIYPNPVKDQLNIEYKFDTPQVIFRELYNLEGVLLFNDKTEVAGDKTEQINMVEYPRGIYILRRKNGEIHQNHQNDKRINLILRLKIKP